MAKKKYVEKYYPTMQRINALYWCMQNGYKIYPSVKPNGKFTMIVERSVEGSERKIVHSPVDYDHEMICEKTFDLAEHLYLQGNDKEFVKKHEKVYLK